MQPLGTINGVYFYQDDLDFCGKLIAEYRTAEAKYAELARTTNPKSRGAYAQKAKQAHADAERMAANLAAQTERIGKFGAVIAPHNGGDW